jgi:4'-phosphopantetheinyl transferase
MNLSSDEKTRADRFRFDKDRRRFILARGLLRQVLSRYAQAEPAALTFTYSDDGKPELLQQGGGQAVRFNLSHSGDVVLIAVTRGRHLGVDVECLDRELHIHEIAQRFFAPEEAAALHRLPVALQRKAFFQYWTVKEAYAKAVGGGLKLVLPKVNLGTLDSAQGSWSRIEPIGDHLETWSSARLQSSCGYAAALVMQGKGYPIAQWRLGAAHADRSGWYETSDG